MTERPHRPDASRTGDVEKPQPEVLVVEDEALLRFEAVDFLEEAGFVVHAAANAAEAIATLEARPAIGIVFSDVQMPGAMDGLGLARHCHDRWPPVRFILTSGHVEIGAGDLPANGVFFFPKPYVTENVVREVRRMAAA